MDRIAIISDIHGNLEALKSVLNDIKKISNILYKLFRKIWYFIFYVILVKIW